MKLINKLKSSLVRTVKSELFISSGKAKANLIRASIVITLYTGFTAIL